LRVRSTWAPCAAVDNPLLREYISRHQ
jgi:hypothetical protein